MATLIVSPVVLTPNLNDGNNGLIQLNYRLEDLTPGVNTIALVGIQLFFNNEIIFDREGITVPDAVATLSGISSVLPDAIDNGGTDGDSDTTHFLTITLNQLKVTDTNNLLLTLPFEIAEQFDNSTQVNVQSFATNNADVITTTVIPSITITIADNNPQISINDLTLIEGNDGTSTALLTVTLNQTSTTQITVDYSTTNGTATAGEDFTTTTGTLTFAPGETEKTIAVDILGDNQVEPDETLTVTLSNPNGATIAAGEGTVTISNDDQNIDPVLVDFTLAGVEDQDIELSVADFLDRFSDEDNDSLKEIRVISLPATGELTLDGNAVVADQRIPQAELDTLRYTPAANANGIAVATLDVKAIDSRDAESVTATIQIDLTAVNDAPRFDLTETSLENPVGTRKTIVDFATNISAGAANESDQSLNFVVEVVRGEEIFSEAPTLTSDGTLSYRFAGVAGTAILRVSLQDDGGTANGGIDASTSVDISITATETPPLPALIPSIGSYTGLLSSGVTFRPTVDGNVGVNTADVAGRTEAVFDNLVGLYQVSDRDGTVTQTNPDGTIEAIAPGAEGYALAALTARVENFTLRAGATRTTVERIEQVGSALLFNGNLYAPFIIANGGSSSVADFIAAEDPNQFNNPAQTASDAVAYFSYQAANPDGAVHLLAYGNGVFGFEDLPANLGISDDDFDDAIFAFSFAAIVG